MRLIRSVRTRCDKTHTRTHTQNGSNMVCYSDFCTSVIFKSLNELFIQVRIYVSFDDTGKE